MGTTKMLSTKLYEQWLTEQESIAPRYREIEKSQVLADYNALKTLIESAEFQSKKQLWTSTKYADSAEGKTMTRIKQLKGKKVVLFYRWFKKDKWKEHADVVEYLTLLEQTQTEEFKQSNAFWKNKKRYFTTDEYQQEKKYLSLAKHNDIVFYLAHTEAEVVELESYKRVWNEEFEGNNLDAKWQTGFLYPSKELKANHSHISELQAYTQGQNTKVGGSAMSIVTKKQKLTAPAWHPTKGMVMHAFGLSSDIWHTVDAVAPKEGKLVAKVCCSGKVKHAISMVSNKVQGALPVLQTEPAVKGYAIHTIVWNKKEVVAYVNNVEVARTANTLSGEAMHLVLRSYLPAGQKVNTGKMEVDWIRIYSK